MSNPLLMEIADLQEINSGIVARQKRAIECLEEMEARLLAWGEVVPGEPTDIINILKGRS